MNVYAMSQPTVYELYATLGKMIDAGHGMKSILILAGRKRFEITQVATRPHSDAPAEIDTRER